MRIGFRLILAMAFALVAVFPARAQEEIRGRAKVLSSDTLEVSGKRYRLFGIIGPGRDQKCVAGALPWLCGNAAYNHLRELAEGKLVTCVEKGLGDDQKLTALCKADGKDLGYVQVRNGWANADPKAGGYQTAESAARASKVGFWKGSQ
ncbi:MAG: thermonuclease family protein [Alphaproteobacteria bacterium]|nr:thermonuclease family protein [Alphaproteobacteria bacterium]